MNRPAVVLAAGTVAAALAGWWMFEVQTDEAASRSLPVLVAGAAAALVVPGLVVARRRPRDTLAAALATTALVTVVGYFRLLDPPWAATAGAAAFFVSPVALVWVGKELAGDRRPAPGLCRTVPVALVATGLVLVSGPQESAADPTAVRAATWATFERLPSGWLEVSRQVNPAALWSEPVATRLLWWVWAAVIVGVTGAATLRRSDGGARPPGVPPRAVHPIRASVAVASAAILVAAWPEAGWSFGDSSVVVDRWYFDLVVVVPAIAAAGLGLVALWAELLRPGARLTGEDAVDLAGHWSPSEAQRRLHDTLGDPSARLLFPVGGDPEGWIDEHGRPTTMAAAPHRAATVVERHGVPVAAIEYEAALAAQPDLVDVAATTTSLALERRRAAAVTRREAAESRAAATRLLVATEESRDRLRREVRDGPDRVLRGVLERLAERPLPVAALHDDLRQAVGALREVARREVPPSLDDLGLRGALEDLAAATGSSISLRGDGEMSLPPTIEVTLFLVVAEHAAAGRALECHVAEVAGSVAFELRGVDPATSPELEERIATLGGERAVAGRDLVVTLPTGPTEGPP